MKNIANKINGLFDRLNNFMSQSNVIDHPDDSNKIILQIHAEFDSAQERLMDSATKMLAELNIKTEAGIEKHAKMHENLGFINSKVVAEHKEVSGKLNLTKETAELISYYKINYPFQKFLTESELDRICKKYNLIYAPVANYIENVPKKNLLEISNAKALQSSSYPDDVHKVKVSFTGSSTNAPIEMKNYFKDPIVVKSNLLSPRSFSLWGYSACLQLGYKGPKPESDFGIILEIITEYKSGLFIAAPKEHFNLKDVNMASQFGYAFSTYFVVKDPIVFRYCKGGLQVLSKWGLEASDELVVNEKCN